MPENCHRYDCLIPPKYVFFNDLSIPRYSKFQHLSRNVLALVGILLGVLPEYGNRTQVSGMGCGEPHPHPHSHFNFHSHPHFQPHPHPHPFPHLHLHHDPAMSNTVLPTFGHPALPTIRHTV